MKKSKWLDRKHCLIHENYVLFKFPASFLWKHSHAQLFMYHLTCLWLAVLHCKYRVGRVVATEIIWLTKSMLFTVCKTCIETFLPSLNFAACHDMEASYKHNVEQKKQDAKDTCELHDLIYIQVF